MCLLLAMACFKVQGADHRQTCQILEKQPGVLAAQPTGSDLHLFLDEKVTSPEKLAAITPFTYERIVPSLEDVFIALVEREELANAA